MNQNRIEINNINNIAGIISDKNIKFTQQEYDIIQQECKQYENKRAASIAALKIVQKNRGWVSDEMMVLISQILCVSVVELEEVATFYNQIFRQPVGRNIIRYCDSIVCYLNGCENIKNILKRILEIAVGDTTKDNRFTLLPTCCLGVCDRAPGLMINEDIHCVVVPGKIIALLESYP